MRQFELHIGELMLHGLPALPRASLAAAIEAELAVLIEGAADFQASEPAGTVPAAEIRVAPGATAEGLGKQIAGAIFSSMGGGAV